MTGKITLTGEYKNPSSLQQVLILYPLYHRIESLNILLHMTEQLEEGITQVKNIIRMEDYDLTEAGARLLVTIEQLIENLEYVNCHLDYLGQAQDKNKDTT